MRTPRIPRHWRSGAGRPRYHPALALPARRGATDHFRRPWIKAAMALETPKVFCQSAQAARWAFVLSRRDSAKVAGGRATKERQPPDPRPSWESAPAGAIEPCGKRAVLAPPPGRIPRSARNRWLRSFLADHRLPSGCPSGTCGGAWARVGRWSSVIGQYPARWAGCRVRLAWGWVGFNGGTLSRLGELHSTS